MFLINANDDCLGLVWFLKYTVLLISCILFLKLWLQIYPYNCLYRRNISLLKIAEQQLQEDVRDKKSAADVDMSIVRLRRRKANHKWVLEGSKYM